MARRTGSNLDALLADACVVISCLIQHGAEPRELAASMGRLGTGARFGHRRGPRSRRRGERRPPSSDRRGERMTGEQMLQHVAGIIAERGAVYGDATTSMAAVAARWSITLGHPVTPAQVVLCLIDLKLARLAHNPKHQDSVCDLAGYAAVLQEVNR